MVFADRKTAVSPAALRQMMTETSVLSASIFSSTQSTRPKDFPSSFGFSFAVHSSLSLSVIAEAGCLENAGEEVIRERLNVFNALNRLVRSGRHACTLNEGLLDIAVLCGRNSVCMAAPSGDRGQRAQQGS